MIPEARLLIEELDAALNKAPDTKHLNILRRVTDLFLEGSENYSNDQITIFDDVISRLIENAEKPALAKLSERLAPVRNAPMNVIARLSRNDDIAVSGPLLEKSSVLTDQTLVEIAEKKSQKHLTVIANRAQINEAVTEAMVTRGNSELARMVVENPGARLSELSFVKLINLAKEDKALALAIAKRTDMPPELEPFLKLALT
jgi:uncharacterized protein (DUF2336 family)